MRFNKYNHEGYRDPTTYEAFTNVERERSAARKAMKQKQLNRHRPLVYICSPYAGDVSRNTRAAQRYCHHAVTMGCIPIAPHLLFPQFMNDRIAEERELAIIMALVLLRKCSEVWVFGSDITPGMQREIRKAQQIGRPIRYFDNTCREVTA